MAHARLADGADRSIARNTYTNNDLTDDEYPVYFIAMWDSSGSKTFRDHEVSLVPLYSSMFLPLQFMCAHVAV